MVNLGVVGLGTIFPMQQEALRTLKGEYTIVAVCDRDRGKWKNCKNPTGEILFYESCTEMFANSEIDCVLIATPPHTHFTLALEGIHAGKDILLEKPAVFSMDELLELYKQAEKQGVGLHIAYHASFAVDVEWYLKHPYGQITSIQCGFYDPYMVDGQIMKGKELLGGSYWDSGVNALSVCARLVDLGDMLETSHEVKQEKNVVYASETTYQNEQTKIIINTGWDQGKNEKMTLLGFRGTKHQILLDHSNQRVVLLKHDGEDEVLYQENDVLRLVNHYIGVFRNYESVLESHRYNKEVSLKIQRLLLRNQ